MAAAAIAFFGSFIGVTYYLGLFFHLFAIDVGTRGPTEVHAQTLA